MLKSHGEASTTSSSKIKLAHKLSPRKKIRGLPLLKVLADEKEREETHNPLRPAGLFQPLHSAAAGGLNKK